MRLRDVLGGLLYTVVTLPSSVLPTPVLSEVPSLSLTTTPFHSVPQWPQWWPTGCWIPWAQATKDMAEQGPKGRPRRSLTQKKKVFLYTGFPKTTAGTPFHRCFLAMYVFNHGFPVAQQLVPIPSWVQFLKHLFVPPNVFKDGIRTLPNTLHNSKRRRSHFFRIK